ECTAEMAAQRGPHTDPLRTEFRANRGRAVFSPLSTAPADPFRYANFQNTRVGRVERRGQPTGMSGRPGVWQTAHVCPTVWLTSGLRLARPCGRPALWTVGPPLG